MNKKINYIIFALIVMIIFHTNILADTTCKYIGYSKNGSLQVEFKVNSKNKIVGDPIVDGNLVSSDEKFINNEKQGVDNWNGVFEKSFLFFFNKVKIDFSGKKYFESNKKCPPYAIFVDKNSNFDLAVSDEEHKGSFIEFGRSNQGYQILELIDSNLVDIQYTINFYKNNNDATGEMKSMSLKYGEEKFLNDNGFNLYGYTFTGWMVKNNGKWLCEDSNKSQFYSSTCTEGNRAIISNSSSSMIKFDSKYPVLELYAKWEPNSNIGSQSINQYGLGSEVCINKGYVWNKTSRGGYCNTDNLTYVLCGDAYDIPSQVPSLISFAVNLLKIATPIILIIVSIITLVKAIVASKEDEIKKAQNSLIKKVIAAAFVFFVVSIVQFIILKVADGTEQNNISSCMSCFLNNDCNDITYYKTNIAGNYFCTRILDSGNGELEKCSEFYKNNS